MNFSMIFSATDHASGVIARIMDSTEGLRSATGTAARATASAAGTMAKGVAAATGAATVGLAGAAHAAIDFESAMADVKKVAGDDFKSPADFKSFGDDLLDLSTRIPMAASGLAEISAEAAGVGIALEDNLRFTEFTAKSAVAFDMAAGLAGDSFAKIGNVYELNQTGLEGMANAVNHLSNSMAAKAPQIVDFINRAGGAAPLLNASVVEMASFGSALIAMGTAPETAARGMTALATNLDVGSQKTLAALQSVGIDHQNFMQMMQVDPGAGLVNLFEAIGASETGTRALKDLVGQDFVDDFSKLTAKPELLADSIALVAKQTEFAGSVQEEFAARADTTANALQLAQNNLNALAIVLGTEVLPAINTGVASIVGFLSIARDETSRLHGIFNAVTGFWGDFLGAFGNWSAHLMTGLDAVSGAFSDLGATIGRIWSLFSGGDAQSMGHMVGTVLAGAFNGLLIAVEGVARGLDFLLTGLESVIKWLQGKEVDWSALIPPIPDFNNAAWAAGVDGLVGIVSGGWEILSGVFGTIIAGAGRLGDAVAGALDLAVTGASAALDMLAGSRGVDRIFEGLSGLAENGFGADFIQGQALTEALAAGEISLESYRARLAGLAAEGGQFAALAGQMLEASQQLDDFAMPAPAAPDLPDLGAIAESHAAIDTLSAAAQALPDLILGALNDVDRQLLGLDFTDHGLALMATLAAGIAAGAHLLTDATSDALQQVRDHLPSSPAKTGPLSDIHQLKFAETIAASINPAPMVAAMRGAAAATRAALVLDAPQPSQAALTSHLRRSDRLGRDDDAAAGARFSVSFGDTHIHGGTPQAQAALLEQHQDQQRAIEDMIRRFLDNQERTKF